MPAQAKVNLVLRVGTPDSSGYHPIATQFQRIDLADDVIVSVGGTDRSVTCDGPSLPAAGLGAPETNLAYRAAVAYAERCGWPNGFAIEITKHIPVGGGLGGGSADAGAVLRCLDALAPAPLGAANLGVVAQLLGADVPFLTGESASAVAVGRGDHWQEVPALPERPIVLAMPNFPISTAEAYRMLDDVKAGTLPDTRISRLDEHAWHSVADVVAFHSWDEAEVGSHNDFELVLEPFHPELRELREGLAAVGARLARLSGSGSTVFGVFGEDAEVPVDLALDALVIRSRTSSRVVQVEVQE